jgi:drug/metabolite transporter (DMT)-like permease
MSVPAAYISVILIWSTTPLAIQWSALDAGYATAVLARMVIGLAVCALALLALRQRLPMHASARATYLVGGLSLFGAMFATYWGARFVPSGLISVLFGLVPLIAGLTAAWWLREPFTPRQIAGVLLGIAGLALIFHRALDMSGTLGLGMLAVFAAVCIQATSLVAIKRIGDHSSGLAVTTGILAVSMPLFLGAWWLAGAGIPEHVSDRGLAAIIYLGLFGSVLGFTFYFHVIKHLRAATVSLITLVTPVIALLLGHRFNGEVVDAATWAGAALIGVGLGLHVLGACRT